MNQTADAAQVFGSFEATPKGCRYRLANRVWFRTLAWFMLGSSLIAFVPDPDSPLSARAAIIVVCVAAAVSFFREARCAVFVEGTSVIIRSWKGNRYISAMGGRFVTKRNGFPGLRIGVFVAADGSTSRCPLLRGDFLHGAYIARAVEHLNHLVVGA